MRASAGKSVSKLPSTTSHSDSNESTSLLFSELNELRISSFNPKNVAYAQHPGGVRIGTGVNGA
jgi:hypothetical protein